THYTARVEHGTARHGTARHGTALKASRVIHLGRHEVSPRAASVQQSRAAECVPLGSDRKVTILQASRTASRFDERCVRAVCAILRAASVAAGPVKVPSVVTSAAVCRSLISPGSAMWG